MRKTLFFLVFFSLMGAIATTGQSIRSVTEGFSVGMFTQANLWQSNSFFLSDLAKDNRLGLGLGIKARYGFTPNLAIDLYFEHSDLRHNGEWDKFRHEVIGLGGVYLFGGSLSPWRPTARVSAGRQVMKADPITILEDNVIVDDDVEMTLRGWTADVGLGCQYFFQPALSLSAELYGRFGSYNQLVLDGTEEPAGETLDTRWWGLQVGLSYSFF